MNFLRVAIFVHVGATTYPILGELGHGWYGTVYRVALPDGGEAAMKVDTEPRSLDEPDVEVCVLKAIQGHSNVGPQLIESFEIITAPNKGRRYTVMSMLGPNLKEFIEKHNLGNLPIFTAASIAVQVIDAVTVLQSVGFIHNDIHSENVAFATPESTSQIVLMDFGNSKNIKSVPLPAAILEQFSVETVFNHFVIPAYPDTDRSWFNWAIESNKKDDSIVDFIANRSWSDLAKVAIRNARNVAEIVRNRGSLHLYLKESVKELASYAIATIDPQTDGEWFEWALLYAAEDSHVANYLASRTVTSVAKSIITETRNLAQFVANDSLSLKQGEIGRILMVFLSLTGSALTHLEFERIMKYRDLSSFPEFSVPVARLVSGMMTGDEPDLGVLRAMFLSLIESHKKSYEGHILWD